MTEVPMDERAKALSDAADLLRKNADANREAAHEQGAKRLYHAAHDLYTYARHMDDAARIVEQMFQPPEFHDVGDETN